MPLCIVCDSRFSHQTHWEPAETCDCTMEFQRDDARDDPERLSALRAWWNASHGMEIDDALAQWRDGGQA